MRRTVTTYEDGPAFYDGDGFWTRVHGLKSFYKDERTPIVSIVGFDTKIVRTYDSAEQRDEVFRGLLLIQGIDDGRESTNEYQHHH